MEICEVLAPLFRLEVPNLLGLPVSHAPPGTFEGDCRRPFFPMATLFFKEEQPGLLSILDEVLPSLIKGFPT